MLNTDLKGLWDSCKNNQMCHLFLLLGVCIFLYSMLSNYMNKHNDLKKIMILKGMIGMNTMNTNTNPMNTNGQCNKDIPRIDEELIRNTINLPNRNPALMTSSMVYPETYKPSDEEVRKTRMDVLNMFYDSFDDDVISISSRPQNLYIIP
jgi:hypothetical protein